QPIKPLNLRTHTQPGHYDSPVMSFGQLDLTDPKVGCITAAVSSTALKSYLVDKCYMIRQINERVNHQFAPS
ncbi:1860_t:CDS:2, partial [Dentiscutata heterogama]